MLKILETILNILILTLDLYSSKFNFFSKLNLTQFIYIKRFYPLNVEFSIVLDVKGGPLITDDITNNIKF